MTSFRYSGAPKPISSLDLIGEYDQLAPYARWWKETAACAGVPLLAISPNSVRFFYVNVVDFAPEPTDKPGRMVVAVTYARSQQIFISILQAKTENIVKHEMLHQILYWWNESRWDDEALPEFVRCGLDVPWTPQRNSISLR